MFWKFLLAAAAAIGLIQLGALSAWLVVLKDALLAVLAVALAMGLLWTWRRFNK